MSHLDDLAPGGQRSPPGPRLVSSYAVVIAFDDEQERFVVVAADLAQAARLALQRLRERSTEGRVISVRFLGEALVG
jgi:hypothetical protein